jgi:uncharacterized membrane protein YuzA (DUF378 family)
MMKLHKITFILLVIGGINWLLVAFVPDWEIGNLLGGGTIATIIYILVGVSAILEIFGHKHRCRACGAGKNNMGGHQSQSMGGGQAM